MNFRKFSRTFLRWCYNQKSKLKTFIWCEKITKTKWDSWVPSDSLGVNALMLPHSVNNRLKILVAYYKLRSVAVKFMIFEWMAPWGLSQPLFVEQGLQGINLKWAKLPTYLNELFTCYSRIFFKKSECNLRRKNLMI